ncbi:DUF2164 domain-containing protein [Cohaesibacter haloalkalitolerans]|uniref:DUF2164 domain-containing protein n=1 Tax=Cohaesibacter haloalkalitolerans TaxID=1162980 RepID=UPI000E64F63B|nr:DUF2164 domain-containing protein [Cohaesibacter haloalkalitolerans]
MSDISFSKEEKQQLVQLLQDYFSENLEQEVGRFEIEFLLDYMIKQLGPVFYNKGLLDARAMLEKHLESYGDDLYGLEKSV